MKHMKYILNFKLMFDINFMTKLCLCEYVYNINYIIGKNIFRSGILKLLFHADWGYDYSM